MPDNASPTISPDLIICTTASTNATCLPWKPDTTFFRRLILGVLTLAATFMWKDGIDELNRLNFRQITKL
jgi:hypothetical protein